MRVFLVIRVNIAPSMKVAVDVLLYRVTAVCGTKENAMSAAVMQTCVTMMLCAGYAIRSGCVAIEPVGVIRYSL